ncbi:MAG TPA: hypothetical protein VG122_19625 [Gemmata sp.]|jgi:hypothetical protein|nr:hypothetical protein [Gemmata sp.]
MTGIGGLGNASSASATQQAQALNTLELIQALSSANASNGVSSAAGIGLTQSSANISGLGQLFSNLQQLVTQNPTQFTQVVSQIASELQSASQTQTGTTSQFLSQLANTLQEAATTGDMPQLQQHHHHALQTQSYNSGGQPVTSGAAVDAQSSFNANLQQLFVTLSQQVGAALNI